MRMRLIPVLGCFFALAGCGDPEEKVIEVKGKLVAPDGSPFKHTLPNNMPLPPGDPGIRVKFIRADSGDQDSFFASVNANEASFVVPGKKGKGIPAGRYTVIVYVGAAGDHRDAKGGTGGAPPGGAPPGGAPPLTPPGGGPPGSAMPSMDGKEVTRTEATVSDSGPVDLTITVDPRKK